MDFFRRTDDGRDQVAAGDLEVDPGIAQEPIDPFNGMFGGCGLAWAIAKLCPIAAMPSNDCRISAHTSAARVVR